MDRLNLLLDDRNELILQCIHLVHIRPGISDDITGVCTAGSHIDTVGEQWIVDGTAGAGSAYDRR